MPSARAAAVQALTLLAWNTATGPVAGRLACRAAATAGQSGHQTTREREPPDPCRLLRLVDAAFTFPYYRTHVRLAKSAVSQTFRQGVEWSAYLVRLTSPSNTAISVWPLADPLLDWEVLT